MDWDKFLFFFFRFNPIKERVFVGCVQQWCLTPLRWDLKILTGQVQKGGNSFSRGGPTMEDTMSLIHLASAVNYDKIYLKAKQNPSN